MESIIVEGGRPLEGKVSISGAKNSVLPLLAAAILFRGGCLLHNCPRLSDAGLQKAGDGAVAKGAGPAGNEQGLS